MIVLRVTRQHVLGVFRAAGCPAGHVVTRFWRFSCRWLSSGSSNSTFWPQNVSYPVPGGAKGGGIGNVGDYGYFCGMRKVIITLAVAALAGLVPAGAQERVRFNPDYSVRDVRVEYGLWAALQNSSTEPTYRMAQAMYTQCLIGPLSWRAGALACWKGLDGFYGVPIGLSLRSRTATVGEALTDAVVYSAADAIDYAIWGDGDYTGLGGMVIWNFLGALFRRSEFTLGVTPGMYTNYRHIGFGLTGDLGLVLAIPIWRFSLNLSPTLHYAFVPNKYLFPEDGSVKPTRLFLSATVGLEYMF